MMSLAVVGHRDFRYHELAIERNELAVLVFVKGAVARVDNFVGLALDLKPADAIQSQIEFVAGAGQRALHVQIANCQRS